MLIDQPPKISCLLVTEGRLKHVERSLRCFQNQSYPNKELVLLSQGNAETNNAIFEMTRNFGNIQFFAVSDRLSLGAMRNLSCEIASGPILCQWDDDDLYFPTRIMDQYKSLKTSDKNVASAFTQFFKYFAETNELYWCDWVGEGVPSSQFLCGSVMFYKRVFHRHNSLLYPEVGNQSEQEEDLNVLFKLLDLGNVQAVGGGYQYLYAYHGKNTYDLEHHKLTLLTNSGKKVFEKDELLAHRGLIETALTHFGIDKPVHARSLSEVAFTYDPQ
jgi:glycosyltransferase involved in cell wall biosynthesis